MLLAADVELSINQCGRGLDWLTQIILGQDPKFVSVCQHRDHAALRGDIRPSGQTVSPAPLTISADDQSMVYGGTRPVLAASYSGLVDGDTAATFAIDRQRLSTRTVEDGVVYIEVHRCESGQGLAQG